MRPPSIVTVRVVKNGALQVSAAENQAVVQAFAADAARPSLRDGVGSGCLYRGSDLSDSQRRDTSIEYGAKTAITVVDQETRVRFRPASFYHLLGQPVRVRMSGDPCVHNLSSTVQGVLLCHAANELSGFVVGRVAARLTGASRPPSPMRLPTDAMPTDDGIRLDDDEVVTPA